jgi:hypothetical protein
VQTIGVPPPLELLVEPPPLPPLLLLLDAPPWPPAPPLLVLENTAAVVLDWGTSGSDPHAASNASAETTAAAPERAPAWEIYDRLLLGFLQSVVIMAGAYRMPRA